jgi:ABC-type transport system substrate-binding protein
MISTRRTFLAGATALGAGSLLIGPGRIGRALAQDASTLIFAAAGTVTSSWDPSSHTIAPQITAEALVFGRLTKCLMKPENPGEILPDLALEWKLIDKYTLEYKLRQGVKFHDGKDFKAEDVKATYEYASQPSRPASAWYPGQVEVEIVDDYTVRLKTEKYGYPALNFWYVSSFLPILSAKDVADPNVLKQRPNGTGAFRYQETKGDQIVFKANADYYDGKPQIETLLWNYVPDANTRVLGLLNGQYHLTERLEPEQFESLKRKRMSRPTRVFPARTSTCISAATSRRSTTSGFGWPPFTPSTATRSWPSSAKRDRHPTATSRRSSSAIRTFRTIRSSTPKCVRSCWPKPASPMAKACPSSNTSPRSASIRRPANMANWSPPCCRSRAST